MNIAKRTGAFVIARKLFDSEFWSTKPSSWKVIWIYILGGVNHKDNGKFKRGEGFFNFSQEYKLIGNDITIDMIKSFLQYARATSMVDTMRTTRGVVIKVLNYNVYQKLDNYKTLNKPRANHERTTTIQKNDKNDKNKTHAPATQSRFSNKKKTMKKNTGYREDMASDEFDSVIDADSGEAEVKPKGVDDAMWDMIKWGEDKKGGKFINLPKQRNALANLRKAKISRERIKDRWIELMQIPYYQNAGIDFTTIVNSFDKKS